jgi:hypothetical protein
MRKTVRRKFAKSAPSGQCDEQGCDWYGKRFEVNHKGYCSAHAEKHGATLIRTPPLPPGSRRNDSRR